MPKTDARLIEKEIKKELEKLAKKYNMILRVEERLGSPFIAISPKKQPYSKVPAFEGFLWLDEE